MRFIASLSCPTALSACGDDTTPPPFDAGTPADGGPLFDGGMIPPPGFECTQGDEFPLPAFSATLGAEPVDIAVAGGSPFGPAENAAEQRAIIYASTADGVFTLDPASEDLQALGDMVAPQPTSLGGGALRGRSNGRIYVAANGSTRIFERDLSMRDTVAGEFTEARGVDVNASGHIFVATPERVALLRGGSTTYLADGVVGERGNVDPKDVALDEARDHLFVASDTGVEVFLHSNLGHIAHLDIPGAQSLALDRYGYLYVLTSGAGESDLVIMHPTALREVFRVTLPRASSRIAVGSEHLAIAGADGVVDVYGLGSVQAHACIAKMELVTPARMVAGDTQQIRAEITGPDGTIDRLSFRRQGQLVRGALNIPFFSYSGVGVASFAPTGSGPADYEVQLMGFRQTFTVDVLAPPASAPLTGVVTDLMWDSSDGVIQVSGTATVPAGATLSIAAGTLVRMAEGALLVIDGDIEVLGTREEPVSIFGVAGGETWSQIHHRGGNGGAGGNYTYRYAFIAGGGNHADEYSYGRWKHCCPPVLYVEEGTFVMEESVIGDTTNKALMISNGDVTLSGCAVQRVGMGPEFEAESVDIDDLWISEVRGIDDNDGIYFWKVGQCCAVRVDVCTTTCGAPYPETLVDVDGLVLADGDDDGVDTQFSFAFVGDETADMSPILRNVIIYGWADKGMSLAGGNSVMDNVLSVFNRNLGIKADDNDPQSEVFPDVLFSVLNSTIAHNANHGLFFGTQGGRTSFSDGSHMTMAVRDSIVYANPENAYRHYDVSTFRVDRSVFPGAIGASPDVTDAAPIFIDPEGGDFRVSPVSEAANLVDGRAPGFTRF
ncbi:MAG: hypothetical protein AB8H86_20295 [Polyangiales bacterium]